VSQKHFTIPVFIPELACPNRCVFCNQQKISGQILIPGKEEIISKIENYLIGFTPGAHIEIGFFGGSFTGVPENEQEHFLQIAQPYLQSGRIHGIRVSTRPDYISEKRLDLLKAYGVTTIELGAQSLDEEVLLKSKRGHTIAHVEEAAVLIRKYGFSLGLQMMTGLPGDTLDKTLRTAHRIVELGADNTRIYPALVIKNTELEDLYLAGLYTPLTIEEAVDRVKQIIPIFEDAGITILRIGLHPSEGLLNGDDLVAGPFHPSFRELAESALWTDLFKPLLELPSSDVLEIYVPEGMRNMAIGYHGINRKQLELKHNKVRFIEDAALQNHQFKQLSILFPISDGIV
jgi:histone acetyltransferase (RNA polymerase elongator complex component)